MSEKKSFVLYCDTIEQWEMLSNEQAGQLIKALLKYGNSGDRLNSDDDAITMAFSFISSQIDRDREKWENAREKRSKFMKEKWQKEKSTIVDYSRTGVTVTGTVNGTGTGTVNGTGTVTGINNINVINNKSNRESIGGQNPPHSPTKRFKKPTLEAMKAYCEERGNVINADKFYDYYESNGWIVGRTKMKDWKAAVRRWEQTEYDNSSNTNTEPELTQGEDGFFYDKNGDRYI